MNTILFRFPMQVYSSGFHRITGLILNGSKNKKNFFEIKSIFIFLVLYTAGPLAILATGHGTEILNYIYAMDIPSWFILSVKIFIAWP
jgi:hypothetical protein